ncbi:MAG: DUF167 domain-containing protein [Acidimicrobiales bacterium]
MTGGAVRFGVRVKPKARAERVGGAWADGSLVVEVQAAAVDGKANTAVVAALADAFDVARSSVTIVTGARSRTKLVAIEGDAEAVAGRLADLLAG